MPTYVVTGAIEGRATVAVEARSRAEAVGALRASVGVGAVRFGELPCGTAICGEAAMSEAPPEVELLPGEGQSECQDCGTRWADADLRAVRHLTERVLPGEPMPSGECPECGALCQAVEETASGDLPGGAEGGVRVHYFDYCTNDTGRWSRCYAATAGETQRRRAEWMKRLGVPENDLESVELTGERGDVTPIHSREIELTADGVLGALNDSDPND
jgi:hypothetical protein